MAKHPRVLATLALFALGAVGCVRATRTAELPVQALSPKDPQVAVRVSVPADWRPLDPSPARAEYVAPDLRTRAYVRAMPSGGDAKYRARIARQYASEVIESWGGPPATRLVHKASEGDRVDFELRRRDPAPSGEVIWSRVLCRTGALAVVSCAGPAGREQELAPVCRNVLESLEIVEHPVPTAPSPETSRR